MDVYSAIRERRSCRSFLSDPVAEEVIGKILEAAVWAPSPMNLQPWEFLVVTRAAVKEAVRKEAERCRAELLEKSGWKWLGRYSVDFLSTAPVLIVVVGDPEKSGADKFIEGGGLCYQHACAAAIQNMLLCAQAEGLGTLWYTLYDSQHLRKILGIDSGKIPLAIVCLGKPAGELVQTPRKEPAQKAVFIR